MKKILLIIVSLSIMVFGSFSRTSNGIVTDSDTEIQWQDLYTFSIGGKVKKLEWSEAIDYCEDLNLAGHSDWRLPNINELHTLVDYKKFHPALDSAFVALWDASLAPAFWSSTTYQEHPHFTFDTSYGNAWYINFTDGKIMYVDGKSISRRVRCIREGKY